MTAARTAGHTHRAEKTGALRSAVLDSVAPGAPDAGTRAVILNLTGRFTPSRVRLVTLWDDPPAWFASRGIPRPQAAFAAGRTVTAGAGLPGMRGRQGFYVLVAGELSSEGVLAAGLPGLVRPPALVSRLATGFGRRLVRFISPPR